MLLLGLRSLVEGLRLVGAGGVVAQVVVGEDGAVVVAAAEAVVAAAEAVVVAEEAAAVAKETLLQLWLRLLLLPLLWSRRRLRTRRRGGLEGGCQGCVLGRRSSGYPPSSLLRFVLEVIVRIRVIYHVQQTHAKLGDARDPV